ncbi:unnamed protein product [Cylindrotheca closterium]|uniref:Uncharacterized protein n=1 Tax=Cylindrotheca closterium TaxID=2856 RepID=A0AAD2FE68_9STRA|nr:unnamed protein product [Cylindrotheca closterium]
MKLSFVVPFLAALIGIANAESVGTIRGIKARDPDGERIRSHKHHSKPPGEGRSYHNRHGSGRVGGKDKPRDQEDKVIHTSTHAEDSAGDKPRSYVESSFTFDGQGFRLRVVIGITKRLQQSIKVNTFLSVLNIGKRSSAPCLPQEKRSWN